jgi:NADH:ubiquinone oxidoreductase subunit 2 (subunit N)
VVEIVAAGLAALAPLPAALMLPTPLGAVALLLAAVPTVVMLQAAGHADANRAALRYFIFTTLAIPFLLLAGWMVLSEQFVFASIFWRLLLAGLALLLAGFPFHIWVRPLLEVAPSLLLPFFFGLVHLILLAFSFRLLQDNALLEGNRQLYPLLRWIGVATALVGAVLAWKPRATRQLVGALLLIDLGSGIAAVSLGDQGIRPALLLIQSRFLSLLLILSGLSLLHYAVPPASGPGSKFRLPRRVWATALFLYGAISLLGLPLTPGFSGRWALLALMATRSLWPPAILLLAMAGGTAGLLAHLHVLSASRPGDPAPFEPAPLSLRAISLFMLTVAILFALFPSLLISLSARLTQLPS